MERWAGHRSRGHSPCAGLEVITGASPYPHAADILSVWVHYISLQGFSSTERTTAKALAEHDPRLTHALHAAVDAQRVGIQGVLTENMLRVTSRGYLATVHTDGFWFSDALDELTQSGRPHDNATAPLIPVPNGDLNALHARAEVGDESADYWLTRLLIKLGHIDEAIVGHHLATILVEHDRVEDTLTFLHDRGDAGDESARCHHARLLAEHDSTDKAIAYLRAHINHQTRACLPICSPKRWPTKKELHSLLRKYKQEIAMRATNSYAFLEKQGRSVEADALRRWGLNPAGTLAGGIPESPFTGRAIT